MADWFLQSDSSSWGDLSRTLKVVSDCSLAGSLDKIGMYLPRLFILSLVGVR